MAKGSKQASDTGKAASEVLAKVGGIPWKIGNVPMRVLDNGVVVIALDLTEDAIKSAPKSSTGKSVLVGSTRGNKPLPGEQGAVLSVNCYVPSED